MVLLPDPIGSSKPIRQLVVQLGDRDPVEVPLDMPGLPGQKFQNPDPKKLVGKQTITVAAGTFVDQPLPGRASRQHRRLLAERSGAAAGGGQDRLDAAAGRRRPGRQAAAAGDHGAARARQGRPAGHHPPALEPLQAPECGEHASLRSVTCSPAAAAGARWLRAAERTPGAAPAASASSPARSGRSSQTLLPRLPRQGQAEGRSSTSAPSATCPRWCAGSAPLGAGAGDARQPGDAAREGQAAARATRRAPQVVAWIRAAPPARGAPQRRRSRAGAGPPAEQRRIRLHHPRSDRRRHPPHPRVPGRSRQRGRLRQLGRVAGDVARRC